MRVHVCDGLGVECSVLGTLLRDLGERLPPEDIQKHFQAMDLNSDGYIDFSEFFHGVERYIRVRHGCLSLPRYR